MVRMVSEAVICRMAKPGKVNGSVGKKKDLINELLDAKTFLSISFYESGLQSQHAKCGRAKKWDGVKKLKGGLRSCAPPCWSSNQLCLGIRC